MCFIEVQISLGIKIEKSNKQNKGKCHIRKNGTQINGNNAEILKIELKITLLRWPCWLWQCNKNDIKGSCKCCLVNDVRQKGHPALPCVSFFCLNIWTRGVPPPPHLLIDRRSVDPWTISPTRSRDGGFAWKKVKKDKQGLKLTKKGCNRLEGVTPCQPLRHTL